MSVRLLARSFFGTVLALAGEVRRIPRAYWIAMVGIAGVGDLLLILFGGPLGS